MSNFKASIGRDVPKDGETRVVFSIRTSRGNRLELDGVFDEKIVLKAWGDLCANQAKKVESTASPTSDSADAGEGSWNQS